jgi:predicted secreted hydrolase
MEAYALTLYKKYPLKYHSDIYTSVTNDNGKNTEYYKFTFITLEEYREQQLSKLI